MKTKFTKLFSAHQQYKYVKCELLKAPESDWEKRRHKAIINFWNSNKEEKQIRNKQNL